MKGHGSVVGQAKEATGKELGGGARLDRKVAPIPKIDTPSFCAKAEELTSEFV